MKESDWVVFQLSELLSRIDPLVLRLRPLVELTRLGVPVGVQMQLEIVAFAVMLAVLPLPVSSLSMITGSGNNSRFSTGRQ